ncbi:MAG: CHAT domain-containing protein [Planctomycetaceae bacterium]
MIMLGIMRARTDLAYALGIVMSMLLYGGNGAACAQLPDFLNGPKSPEQQQYERTLNQAVEHLKAGKKAGEAGNLSEGLQQAKKSLELYLDLLGADHFHVTHPLRLIAELQARSGDFSAAIQTTDQLNRRQQQSLGTFLRTMPPRAQSSLLDGRDGLNPVSNFVNLAITAQDTPGAVERSAEWLLNLKAVGIEAFAAQQLLRPTDSDPARTEHLKSLERTGNELGWLVSIPDFDMSENRQERIANLRKQHLQLQRELQIESHGLALNWISLDAVRRVIPANGVCVDFVRYDAVSFQEGAPQAFRRQYKPHYAAWVIWNINGPDTMLVDLGDAQKIDDLIAELRRQLNSADADNISELKHDEDAAAAGTNRLLSEISVAVIRPLHLQKHQFDQLVASPDGDLWLLPWAALPLDPDVERPIIADASVTTVVSPRNLLKSRPQNGATRPCIFSNASFDLEGDQKMDSIRAIFRNTPEMGDDRPNALFQIPPVASLPGTKIEAQLIAPSIKNYTGLDPNVYEQQYSLEHVASRLQSPRIVVFATHGFFLPQMHIPGQGSLVSRTVPGVKVQAELSSNPLLRCGLLLAGCNDRDSAVGADDGVLTGEEIVGIDLRGTELVVLSACETGIGDVRSGEGVAGLRQAFQLAGAQAVVSTLWQVPDRDSALLMSRFFEELAAGKSKSESLRNAQLERIEKRRERYGAAHPFFWAAFTLTGN